MDTDVDERDSDAGQKAEGRSPADFRSNDEYAERQDDGVDERHDYSCIIVVALCQATCVQDANQQDDRTRDEQQSPAGQLRRVLSITSAVPPDTSRGSSEETSHRPDSDEKRTNDSVHSVVSFPLWGISLGLS